MDWHHVLRIVEYTVGGTALVLIVAVVWFCLQIEKDQAEGKNPFE